MESRMSKNIDDILKEITKSNKDLSAIDCSISKETSEIKKNIKSIDTKLKNLEKKIDSIAEILNTFIILIGDEAEDEDAIENQEWSPYNDYDIENYDETKGFQEEDEEDNY
jgi:archaellum component FlaC